MQHRARLVLHGIVVEQPERRPQLAAEKEVGRRVEIVGQGERLVDGLDAVAAGVARRRHLPLLAVDVDLENGSASCRESVCEYVSDSVVAVSLKKKKRMI